jgi:D-glycero-D-manno-heptose 1,7-bisphosphate phosphatase
VNRTLGACAVFLDRDGVINEVVFRHGRPTSPRTVTEFRFCDGILEPLDRLVARGYRLFVVTNQPDVTRGLLPLESLEAMTNRILATLPVERVLTCTHDDADGCSCRKPKPGLLQQAADTTAIDLAKSFIIGDSWKDVQAGCNAGCKTILLQRDYNQGISADYRVDSLSQAVELILKETRHEGTSSYLCRHVS